MAKSSRLVFTILVGLLTSPVAAAYAVDDVCLTPGANKNLSNCVFTDKDLSGTNFENSILTGADLTRADLSDTDLTGVSSGSIKGVPSRLPVGWALVGGYLLGPGADLSGATLTNLNLKNLDLSDAKLPLAQIKSSDLTNTNFSGANLDYATILNSNLANVNLTDASLTGVYSRTITGTPASLPTDWSLIQGYLVGPSANLNDSSFNGVNFTTLNITGASFVGAVIRNSNFSGLDFSNFVLNRTAFLNVNLSNSDLENSDLAGECFSGVTGVPASLPNKWKLRNGYLFGPEANLTSLDFTNMNFSGLDITGANLSGSNFTNANLAGMDLSSVRITDVNMSGANLDQTNLTGLTLKGWIAHNVSGTPIGLNPDWQSLAGYLIGPGANLSSVDFSGVDLRNAKLQGVNFIYADLTDANLAGVDLTGVNLTGVHLIRTNLTNTRLTGATLTSVQGQGIVGTPVGLPDNWRFLSGFLLGPSAALASTNLSGLYLRDIDLTGADLRSAQLSGADLRGAKLTGANISGADFTNAKLLNVVSGDLIGSPIGLPTTFTLEAGTLKSVLVLSPTPTTTGIARVGSKLTAVAGTWDEGVTLSYQWFRNGESIPAATDREYLLTPDDLNKAVSVTVTGTGTGGVSRAKQSLDKPIAAGLMKAVAPKISGVVAKGKTIKATVRPWVADATITYTWLLDGKPIKGATKGSYKILPTQVGKKISVSVKQVAIGYTTTSKVSSEQKIGK